MRLRLSLIRMNISDQSVYIRVLEGKLEASSVLNARLRGSMNNYEILQDSYASLKKELAVAQKLRDKIVDLEADMARVRSSYELELSILSLYSSEGGEGRASISSVIELLETERIKHACLLQEKGSLCVQVRIKELEAEYANSEVSSIRLPSTV